MSRLQDGRMTIETEEMEVNFILEEAAARVRKTAAEAGVDLQVQAREKLICQGNEDRILQVLTIFLDNALSFTPAGRQRHDLRPPGGKTGGAGGSGYRLRHSAQGFALYLGTFLQGG